MCLNGNDLRNMLTAKNTDITLSTTNFLKGLAILAVVFIHTLAYFPGIYHGQGQVLFISLDQLARFCMPVFIMLSGYGLASKYERQVLHYLPFLRSRIIKLLPLYFLWSIYSILIIKAVPAWSFANQPMSVVIQILFGQADYQLYFLPVIFQLYALFPLFWGLKQKPKLMFSLALFIQVVTFYLYTWQVTSSDRLQYVLVFSWLAYFVWGIYLKIQSIPHFFSKYLPCLAIITFLALSFYSWQQITNGIDPLPALKFTRLIVIPFALTMSATLLTWKYQSTNFFYRFIALLGKHSYLIFLAHTIALRIIYTIVLQKLEMLSLLMVILSWLLMVLLSWRLLNKK